MRRDWVGEQACLYGTRALRFACEGGHADFAAQGELEFGLLRFLQSRFGHVSNERILSGPAANAHEFIVEHGPEKPSPALADAMKKSDPAAAISQAALRGTDATAEKALELWISIYGAEAGNLALKTMATGGLFLTGGISPKILDKLKEPGFMQAFVSKGRLTGVLEAIPVRVVTNEKAGLLGAARCAAVRSAASG